MNKPSKNLKTLPQIWDKIMHGVQKRAPDSGQTYARGAETCLRFRAYLCTGCRNVPRIQGILMHGGQKHDPDPRQTYARGAETCPRFRAYLCTGCRNVPQIQGRFLHGVHNLLPNFRRYFEFWQRYQPVMAQV